MTTYTWTFPQFDAAPTDGDLTNVVKTIHWRLDANDDGVTVGAYGTVALDDPDPETFVPFAQITHEWAIAQCEAKLDMAAIQTALESQIEAVQNPPTVPMVPPFAS